jgi:hypothetical protein
MSAEKQHQSDHQYGHGSSGALAVLPPFWKHSKRAQ